MRSSNGIIEWYDRHCIKVNRETEPNLLIPKHSIKYMYKEHESKEHDEGDLGYLPDDSGF